MDDPSASADQDSGDMSGAQERNQPPGRSPPPSPSSSDDYVPFLSNSSDSDVAVGGPLPYADGPIIMLTLPDDGSSPVFPSFATAAADVVDSNVAHLPFDEITQRETTVTSEADPSVESPNHFPEDVSAVAVGVDLIGPNLAQLPFNEIAQKETTVTSEAGPSVKSPNPSPNTISAAAATAVATTAENHLSGSDLAQFPFDEIAQKETKVTFKAGPSMKPPHLTLDGVSAIAAGINSGFEFALVEERAEQKNPPLVSGAVRSPKPPRPAVTSEDRHDRRRIKATVSRKRRRGARIRSASSSPEASPLTIEKGKNSVSGEVGQCDNASNSHLEDASIKMMVEDVGRNQNAASDSLKNLKAQEGNENGDDEDSGEAMLLRVVRETVPDDMTEKGFPRNVFDVLDLMLGDHEPDKRFENVDILEIARMKGLDVRTTPRWWRPGGYDVPMYKAEDPKGRIKDLG